LWSPPHSSLDDALGQRYRSRSYRPTLAMSSSSSSSPASGPVKISYPALLSDPASLLPSIARAFGSEEGCLGIILIEGRSSGSGGSVLSFRCASLVCPLLAPIRVRRLQLPTLPLPTPTPNSNSQVNSQLELQLSTPTPTTCSPDVPTLLYPSPNCVDLTACTPLGPHAYRPAPVPAVPANPPNPARPNTGILVTLALTS
jgi:hypothetical protein